MTSSAASQNVAGARFLVLDFETVTPKGRPPEPIEVAGMVVSVIAQSGDQQVEVFEEFIKPPPGAPVTAFDTHQTGIRPQDVANAASAPSVLVRLDAFGRKRVDAIVAQNAKYEAAIIRRFSAYCEHLAQLPFIDTVLLAKDLYPTLTSYALDGLARELGIQVPARRHRALPDVELTAAVFLRLLDEKRTIFASMSVQDLIEIASPDFDRRPKPAQGSLFD